MSIDVAQVVGAQLPSAAMSWDERDVILYHLGLGAGADRPTDPDELAYLYEGFGPRVLPSFGVLPGMRALMGMFEVPGMSIDHGMVLHGEQEIVLHAGPLPAQASTLSTGCIEAVYDKGSGAVVVGTAETRDEAGTLLCTNRMSAFVRGEGGFGGDPGPKRAASGPHGDPDRVVEVSTLPHQALIYRLSGDLNPLHVDPDAATRAGFTTPILHGLSTYGVVCKAVVDELLGGQPGRVRAYRVRFSGVVYPGETIRVSMWSDGDMVFVEATAVERDEAVLSGASLDVVSP